MTETVCPLVNPSMVRLAPAFPPVRPVMLPSLRATSRSVRPGLPARLSGAGTERDGARQRRNAVLLRIAADYIGARHAAVSRRRGSCHRRAVCNRRAAQMRMAAPRSSRPLRAAAKTEECRLTIFYLSSVSVSTLRSICRNSNILRASATDGQWPWSGLAIGDATG